MGPEEWIGLGAVLVGGAGWLLPATRIAHDLDAAGLPRLAAAAALLAAGHPGSVGGRGTGQNGLTITQARALTSAFLNP